MRVLSLTVAVLSVQDPGTPLMALRAPPNCSTTHTHGVYSLQPSSKAWASWPGWLLAWLDQPDVPPYISSFTLDAQSVTYVTQRAAASGPMPAWHATQLSLGLRVLKLLGHAGGSLLTRGDDDYRLAQEGAGGNGLTGNCIAGRAVRVLEETEDVNGLGGPRKRPVVGDLQSAAVLAHYCLTTAAYTEMGTGCHHDD